MLGVARTSAKSKEMIAVFEALSPQTGITSVMSPDDGKTWGKRRVIYKSTVSKATQNAPQVVRVGSTLVASFHTNEDDVSQSDGDRTTKVVFSSDQGATWNHKMTVHKKCVLAGMTVIDENNFLVFCGSLWNVDGTPKTSYSQRISLA